MLPLVLLPGTLCDERLFAPLLPRLADVAEVCVASVGAGETVAEVAREVLRAAPTRFALGGLSYGGIVAFEIMRQAPERVTRLALMNTTPAAPSDATRARLVQIIAMIERGQFREITTVHLKDLMLHPARRADAALRRLILDMAERIGPAGGLRQFRAQLARPDSTATLAAITCPALVLAGRDDRVCTVHMHEAMAARLQRARMVIIEECGHLSPLEQPEAAAHALRNWLLWQPAPLEMERRV